MRERSSNTRTKIYETLMKLMETEDFHDITITELCQNAGVSRMAYYRNFDDKKDILFSFYNNMLQESFERLKIASSELTVSDAWKALVRECRSDKVIANIVRAGFLKELMRTNEQFLTRVYRDIFNYDMEDPRNRMIMYSCIGAIGGLVVYCYVNNNNVDESCADRIIDAISEIGAKLAANNKKIPLR